MVETSLGIKGTSSQRNAVRVKNVLSAQRRISVKNCRVVILAIVLSFPLFASSRAGVVEDSVLLDRSYVPALALTNQKDKPQSIVEESIHRFSVAWDKFTKSVLMDERSRAVFEKAIQQSSPKVAEAARLAGADKRKDAHEALETVRSTFQKARGDSGILYLPDLFTAFHEPMEEFAEFLSRPNLDQVELKGRIDRLSQLWKDVERTGLDQKLFDIGPEKAMKYRELTGKEREVLTQIEGLIVSGQHQDLSKAATAMKGYFSQAYFVFGDFSGL
jgi:hypothetical protein